MDIRRDPKLRKYSDDETSIASLFYEDEYGKPVSEDVKTAVRQDLAGYWTDMVKKGKVPTAWGAMGIEDRNMYRQLMESKYPWLRLCAGHWKSGQIWISNWKGDNKKFKDPITITDSPPASSPIDISSESDPPSPDLKRKRVKEEEPSPVLSKRQKEKTRAVETPPFHPPPSKPRPVPTKKSVAKVATVRIPISSNANQLIHSYY